MYTCMCVYDVYAYVPVALISLLVTSTVISIDDGLLNVNWISTTPLFSLTLYTDWLNLTVIAI